MQKMKSIPSHCIQAQQHVACNPSYTHLSQKRYESPEIQGQPVPSSETLFQQTTEGHIAMLLLPSKDSVCGELIFIRHKSNVLE